MTWAPVPLPAIVLLVDDGDTIKVQVPEWVNTPFGTIKIRIAGIDTPESRQPPAKCTKEVKLGKTAAAFAKTLVVPGQNLTFQFIGFDKYGDRIVARVLLPDGRDWGTVMTTLGYARPYSGGTKQSWCKA